ncbi:unnamed protein product [Debaryomyces tyrocola]|nr:unnamed protein product [Debaryomyces tyrocola]
MLITSTRIMSSSIVSITSSSASKESPVTTEYLTEVISEDINKLSETNALIEFLLAKLQKKSSKHKFLIQATRLKSPSPIETNLNILTSFGAVWDSNRDGYISLKVELKGDKDTEAEKKGDLIEETTEKVLDEEVNDELNSDENKIEENTLEAGPNDEFNNEDTTDALSTTDIKPDVDDDIKTGEEDDYRLKEQSSATELEDDDKVKEHASGITESDDIEEDLKEEVRTTEPKDDDSLKEDVVDSKKPEYMGQDGKAEGRGEKDSPILKKEVDSSTDTILVTVYWVFVD